jgi:hypothetical protein
MRMRIRMRIQVTKMIQIHADPDPDADLDPQVITTLAGTGNQRAPQLAAKYNQKELRRAKRNDRQGSCPIEIFFLACSISSQLRL